MIPSSAAHRCYSEYLWVSFSLYRKQIWITWRTGKSIIRYSAIFNRRRNCGIPNQGHSKTFHVKWKHFKWNLIKNIPYHSLPMWLDFSAKIGRMTNPRVLFIFDSSEFSLNVGDNWPFTNYLPLGVTCASRSTYSYLHVQPFKRLVLKQIGQGQSIRMNQ